MDDCINCRLTAEQLMSRNVSTIECEVPLREAAARLTQAGLRGMPVVNHEGRCVGVLSVSDLARWWSGGRHSEVVSGGCQFQERRREPGGREVVICTQPEGMCPFQTRRQFSFGPALSCSEPDGMPTDWQMVQPAVSPAARVRDIMTTDVVSVCPEATIAEIARLMLERGVHRLIVLDSEERPVGVLAVDDLLQVLAHPELVADDAGLS
jgi:predicted transcriptional regulator